MHLDQPQKVPAGERFRRAVSETHLGERQPRHALVGGDVLRAADGLRHSTSAPSIVARAAASARLACGSTPALISSFSRRASIRARARLSLLDAAERREMNLAAAGLAHGRLE